MSRIAFFVVFLFLFAGCTKEQEPAQKAGVAMPPQEVVQSNEMLRPGVNALKEKAEEAITPMEEKAEELKTRMEEMPSMMKESIPVMDQPAMEEKAPATEEQIPAPAMPPEETHKTTEEKTQ